jgi:hypothetical protein
MKKLTTQRKLKAQDMKKVRGGILRKTSACPAGERWVETDRYIDEDGNGVIEGHCEPIPPVGPFADFEYEAS